MNNNLIKLYIITLCYNEQKMLLDTYNKLNAKLKCLFDKQIQSIL